MIYDATSRHEKTESRCGNRQDRRAARRSGAESGTACICITTASAVLLNYHDPARARGSRHLEISPANRMHLAARVNSRRCRSPAYGHLRKQRKLFRERSRSRDTV